MKTEKQAVLCLGSNIGEKQKNILTALSHIEKKMKVLKKTRIYKTQPVEFEDQSCFYNMAAEVKTFMTPEELLFFIKQTEKSMGRKESFRYGPRIIDIDILLYSNETYESRELVIPHKSILERHFALKLLMDIDENMKIPGRGITVREAFSLVDKSKSVLALSEHETKGVQDESSL